MVFGTRRLNHVKVGRVLMQEYEGFPKLFVNQLNKVFLKI